MHRMSVSTGEEDDYLGPDENPYATISPGGGLGRQTPQPSRQQLPPEGTWGVSLSFVALLRDRSI